MTTTALGARETRGTDRVRFARLAAYAVGPFFLGSILLNSWANIDFLQMHGWKLSGGKDVPWPSVLARAPHGWIQILTFALAGVLVLVFAHGLRAALPARRTARAAGWLVTLFGMALVASAAPLDAAMVDAKSPTTWHGVVHGLAFLIVVVSVLLGSLLLGPGLRRVAGWRPLAVVSPVFGVAMAAALIAGPHGQGTFIVYLTILFAWVATLGGRLGTRAPQAQPADAALVTS